MIQINHKRLNNLYYVNSLPFSPFNNKRFWDSFQNNLITNNFIKKVQKDLKVIVLLNSQMLDNINYLTLKDLDQDQKNPVFEYLKKLVPSVFQDGILNFDLLKQHLNPDEKIIQNTRNFLGLDWATKEKAKLEYSKNVKNKTLLPDVNRSLNFDQAKNIIIEGDNLEALKILQSAYQEQVDVIYIDPPYNTGNDFVYNDNFKQGSYEYKLANGLIDEDGLKTTTNQKTNARIHSNWLDMIYPRLKVARNLLKEDGVIFISIDDHEHAHLKLICDEIFNEQNFVASMIWRKKNTGGGSDKVTIEIETEYILCYAKNKEKLSVNSKPIDASKYLYKDEYYETRGAYNITDLDRVCSTSSFKYQPTLDYEIQAPDGTWFKNYRNLLKEKSYAYTLGKELFDFCNENGFIEFKKTSQGYWKAYRKSYQLVTIDRKNKKIIKREDGNSYNNIIDQSNITTSAGKRQLIELLNDKDFSFPKPTPLIKYLINLHRNKNALVLDFFAGSGTTAQAVMELNQEDGGNRKYVLVQLAEPIENNPEFKTICDITKARIIRSIEKYQYNDLGFKYFKIGKSNFPIWQVQTDDSDEIIESQLNVFESLNSNQNYESMLYELMIREGMRFDENIQLHQIDDYQFWADEFFNYLFFLEPINPNNLFQVIKQIIENKEQEGKTRIYINEAYFDDLKGDEMKLNLAEQISQYKKEIQLVVV